MKDKQFKIVRKKRWLVYITLVQVHIKMFLFYFHVHSHNNRISQHFISNLSRIGEFWWFSFSSLTVCIMKITILWGRGLPLSAWLWMEAMEINFLLQMCKETGFFSLQSFFSEKYKASDLKGQTLKYISHFFFLLRVSINGSSIFLKKANNKMYIIILSIG